MTDWIVGGLVGISIVMLSLILTGLALWVAGVVAIVTFSIGVGYGLYLGMKENKND